MTHRNSFQFRFAFTLVELLVVMTIIGILMAMLLPAINAARENGRQLQCQNNLNQIGKATQNHITSKGTLPSGGKYNYIGQAERDDDTGKKYDEKQVGGWIFNLLPFLEQGALYEMTRGTDDNDAKAKAARGRVAATPIPLFYCPSRRKAQGYPMDSSSKPANMSVENVKDGLYGKTDYAANGGNSKNIFQGAEAATIASNEQLSGVVRPMKPVSDKEIRDGKSHTILAAEKYLPPEQYETGSNPGDKSVWLVGWSIENIRFAPYFNGQNGKPELYTGWETKSPTCDETAEGNKVRMPRPDTRGEGTTGNVINFGSAHSSFMQAVMVDSSVRQIKYAINPKVFGCLCNRADDVGINPMDLN